MANVDQKFGMRPVRTIDGGNVNQQEYSINTTYATAIYAGDVVEMTGTGRQVSKAAATNVDNIGVFVGCSYTDAVGKPIWSGYWPGVSDGKSNIKAYVVSDPDAIFVVQADSCAEGDVGALCDWNVGTGSTLTGTSGLYAVVNGATATTGKALRILGLANLPGNDYGAYAKIEVFFANHVLGRVVSAVGGI